MSRLLLSCACAVDMQRTSKTGIKQNNLLINNQLIGLEQAEVGTAASSMRTSESSKRAIGALAFSNPR